MISDDERREVVKRLRNGGVARDPEEAYTLLLWCVGIRPQLPATSTYEDAMVRLADLIDRQTCHIIETYHEYEDSVRCDRCRMTFSRPWEPFKYCPNCGAEVTDGGGCDVREL